MATAMAASNVMHLCNEVAMPSRISAATSCPKEAAFLATRSSGGVASKSSAFCGTSFSSVSPYRAERRNAGRVAGVIRAEGEAAPSGRIIRGKCFVVEDNIDTDQIIPAEYLTLVPSKPDEYEKLGSYAMIGLPQKFGKYIEDGEMKTEYAVMIGGANFGCGSSREHAPVAMGAAGCRVVVAESYARIFFRNCVATGELYPVESEERLCEVLKTGDEVTVDMEHDFLINHTTGQQHELKPIGEAGPVIDAGGIFNFARASGMIATVEA